MTPYTRTFKQPDGSTLICEARRIDGVVVRLPNRIIKADGTEAKAAPAKEPRRIESKRTHQPASRPAAPKRETRWDCEHRGDIVLDDEGRGKVVKHLCGGCPGGQIATVAFCELHEVECLPAAWAPTPDSTARRCADCPSYRKSIPPTPGAE